MAKYDGDPAFSGPGLWFALHLMSWEVRTTDEINYIIKFVYDLSRSHPCGNCRAHMTEYLNNNDIHKYKSMKDKNGKLIGMFKYMWEFHNTVNARLRKEYYSFEDAVNTYNNLGDSPFCDLSCGSDDGHSPSPSLSDDDSSFLGDESDDDITSIKQINPDMSTETISDIGSRGGKGRSGRQGENFFSRFGTSLQ